MKKVTIWKTVSDDGVAKLNHIEDGWNFDKYPKPKSKEFTNQTAWENMKWESTHGFLNSWNHIINVHSFIC